ncbi:methyltransferase-like protein 27 [Apostichopus japonicus]|uniref:methyltransferase-like protein 27 n=1 Tax=Stichopus japonicus TaxID=307972 RepID=UPI003AB85874
MTEEKAAQSTEPTLKNLYSHVKNSQQVGSDTIKELYDSWVPSYDKDLINNHKYIGPSKVSAVFADHCPIKDASILDCGAGTGLVGEKLHALGFTNISGLDISQKSLDVAAQKGLYKKLVCAQVGKENMPFNDDEFDGLVCSGCMVPSHMSPSCFREWVRVVKPGGIIALVMRRAYVELLEGEEEYFYDYYKNEFDTVVEELDEGKRWQLSKIYFPGYLKDCAGLALVAKVL